MAKIKIQGHASGTGILTVTAPNTSTDRTITLPDATGTLLNSDGSGASLTSLPNGLQLDYSGAKKIEATSTGVAVVGSTVHTEGDVKNTISGTYKLFGANGTAGSNSYVTYCFEGDNDTGMNRGGADILKFVTGGTERLQLTSDGRGLSQFTAKAWVNFDGTGTVAIRDSHNVSSIADNGTGDYYVNFSNNMANSDYAVGTSNSDGTANGASTQNSTASTSFIRLMTRNSSGTLIDTSRPHAMVFGD